MLDRNITDFWTLNRITKQISARFWHNTEHNFLKIIRMILISLPKTKSWKSFTQNPWHNYFRIMSRTLKKILFSILIKFRARFSKNLGQMAYSWAHFSQNPRERCSAASIFFKFSEKRFCIDYFLCDLLKMDLIVNYKKMLAAKFCGSDFARSLKRLGRPVINL